ncbi:MAG: biotin/lipoyl-containing protein, partial [Actinomycetota bacterium]
MSAVFTLPDLGEGLTEAEVLAWRVAVGDTVETDQVVVEVETAKAAVEVPCPFAGRVTALHAEPGTVLPVGQPLITVEPTDTGSGNVLIGYGTGAAGARPRRRRVGRPGSPASTPAPAPARPSAVRVISPIVRRLASERGVDLAGVTPSGPGGVIRRADVESLAAAPAAAAAAAASAPAAPRDGETRVPLRGLRRAVADKVSRSRREIPDVTIWVDVDATGLL